MHVTGPDSTITICTQAGYDDMIRWRDNQGLGKRVLLSRELPAAHLSASTAVIVVNAAHDHAGAVREALRAGCPVLVEKPVAPTFQMAQELVELAEAQRVPLAAAQVFLFASYYIKFAEMVIASGQVDTFTVTWSDPAMEVRYGETKRYDSSVTVFLDWLPHVVPALLGVIPAGLGRCARVAMQRGGARVELEFAGPTSAGTIVLERNASQRTRSIVLGVGGRTFALDFAIEPGTISTPEGEVSGDSGWSSSPRPLHQLLNAYLALVSGGEPDPRLSIEAALHSCRIVDQVRAEYDRLQAGWVIEQLERPEMQHLDFDYALLELIQKNGRLPEPELAHRCERVKALAGPGGLVARRKVLAAADPIEALLSFGAASRSA